MITKRVQKVAASMKIKGLYVYTYSPGDGVTRYRISPTEHSDYFACKALYTALGIKELELAAYLITIGYYHGKAES